MFSKLLKVAFMLSACAPLIFVPASGLGDQPEKQIAAMSAIVEVDDIQWVVLVVYLQAPQGQTQADTELIVFHKKDDFKSVRGRLSTGKSHVFFDDVILTASRGSCFVVHNAKSIEVVDEQITLVDLDKRDSPSVGSDLKRLLKNIRGEN